MSSSSEEEEEEDNQRRVGNAFAGLILDSDDSDDDSDSNSDGNDNAANKKQIDDVDDDDDDTTTGSEDENKDELEQNAHPKDDDLSEFDDLTGRSTRHGAIIQADYVHAIQQLIAGADGADGADGSGADKCHTTNKPTKIQCDCWTTMLSPLTRERDVIAISKTGSGKTLAFLVPLLASLTAPKSKPATPAPAATPTANPQTAVLIYPRAIILAPTRVIAQQIFDVASTLVRNTPSLTNVVKVSVALGGSAYHQQIADLLSTDPDVIIATPGRLNSLCGHVKTTKNGTTSTTSTTTTSTTSTTSTQEKADMCIKLDEVSELVIDEADMMLALGFANDLSWFAHLLNADSAYGFRLVLTSATWEEETSASLSQFESSSEQEPVLLMTAKGAGRVVTTNVTQRVEVLAHKGAPRFKYLCQLLTAALLENSESSRVIVFCLHKAQARQLGKDLRASSSSSSGSGSSIAANDVVVLEGDMSQSARAAAIKTFRNNGTTTTTQGRILVATDVAARGLDVLDVSHVFNYSLGISMESYIHRCGRTGRAGRFGIAHTFVVKGDEKMVPELCTVLRQANQYVSDDLRIMASKELKRRQRGPAGMLPKKDDDDAMELEELRQANRAKQLLHNQQHQRGSKQGNSKRRGRK